MASGVPQLSLLADPLALARLQILIVPVGPSLTKATFDHWTKVIRQFKDIRVGDLPDLATARGTKARFLPAPVPPPQSHLHLSYLSHPTPRSIEPLSLFRVSAFPLAVVGVFDSAAALPDGTSNGGEPSTPIDPSVVYKASLNIFNELVDQMFPSGSAYPLARRLFGVGGSGGHSPEFSNDVGPGKGKVTAKQQDVEDSTLVLLPKEGNVDAMVGMAIAEMCGDILSEFGELAMALESHAGLQTLSSTLIPTLTLNSQISTTLFTTSPSATPVNGRSTPTTANPSINLPPRSPATPGFQSQPPIHSMSLPPLGPIGSRSNTPVTRPLSSLANGTSSIAASSNPLRRSTATLTSPFSRTKASGSSSNLAINVTSPASPFTSAPVSGLPGGRLLKILGDLWLLSGGVTEAIGCYTEAIERAKKEADCLWQGAAQEGLATALICEAWEGRDGSDHTTPLPQSPIPTQILELFNNALQQYSRSTLPFPNASSRPSTPGSNWTPAPPQSSSSGSQSDQHQVANHSPTGEALLTKLHTSLSVRIAHFQLLIWASAGWGSIALSSLIAHGLPRSFWAICALPSAFAIPAQQREQAARRQKMMLQLSMKSQIQRHQIAQAAQLAIGPWHKALNPKDQLDLWVSVAWVLRLAGLERREAWTLREVVRKAVGLLARTREEARRIGPQPQTPSGVIAPKPVHASADTVGLGLGLTSTESGQIAVRRRESTEGNQALVGLVDRVLDVFGIVTTDEVSTWETEGIRRPKYGWPELQVEVAKEAVLVGEALPDHRAVIRHTLTALQNLHAHLSPQAQHHLSKTYPKALATARRRGLDIDPIHWWVPERMVLSVEVAGLQPNRLPIAHARGSAELSADSKTTLAGVKDPFLYNPRLRAAAAGKTMAVQNEQLEFFVTVQNPFAFDLDVQDLSLITAGVPFVSSPLPLVIPPCSVQTVRLTGIATEPGQLSVRGAVVRLMDGCQRKFLLPNLDDTEVRRRDKYRSQLGAELLRVKKSGLAARAGLKAPSLAPLPEDGQRYLETDVVPSQPLLWVKRTSLTHGSIMLFDGEESMIRITLENTSPVPVDFIKLTFDDSTARASRTSLAERDLTLPEAYELEWDLLNRPVFEWHQPDPGMIIAPGAKQVISVRCFGKVGCTDGSIRIDYGHLGQSDIQAPTFYTRQVTLPVLLTVFRTLESHSLNLIRFTGKNKDVDPSSLDVPQISALVGPPSPSLGSIPRQRIDEAAEIRLRDTIASESDIEHCLVSIDIRNVYGQPFEVTFERRETTAIGEVLRVSRLIPPGSTERLLLPVRRKELSPSDLKRPIPSLSDRQFVVAKEVLSEPAQDEVQSLFWYREDLLRSFSGTWREPGTRRHGILSLRQQIMSPAMLEVYRSSKVEVHLQHRPQHVAGEVKLNDYIDLVVQVRNNLDRSFRPRVRIEIVPNASQERSWAAEPSRRQSLQVSRAPAAAVATKHIAIDGTFEQVCPTLKPGDTCEHTVSVTFLASGRYVFQAAVEEVSLSKHRRETISASPQSPLFSPRLSVHVAGMKA